MRLSNTFIIGAPKCGTSTVSEWLNRHSECALIEGKESNFWRRDYYKGHSWYNENFMRYYDEKILVDASTINLVLHYSPQRIKLMCPDPKIIVCIRNPWERMFSHWRMIKSWRPGRVHDNFGDEIKENLKTFNPNKFLLEGHFVPYLEPKGECYLPTYIEQSCYSHNLKYYEKYFKNIHIIKFEDILNNGVETYEKLCDFLNIKRSRSAYIQKHDPNTKTNDDFKQAMFSITDPTKLKIDHIFDAFAYFSDPKLNIKDYTNEKNN